MQEKIIQKSNGSLKESKNVKWLSDGTNDYPYKNNNGGDNVKTIKLISVFD